MSARVSALFNYFNAQQGFQYLSYVQKKPRKRYYLGQTFKEIYLTAREAETTIHLLFGKTIRGTAFSMQVSPRTVEFYMNNIKRKLGCRRKAELIGKIVASDFLQIINSCSA